MQLPKTHKIQQVFNHLNINLSYIKTTIKNSISTKKEKNSM